MNGEDADAVSLELRGEAFREPYQACLRDRGGEDRGKDSCPRDARDVDDAPGAAIDHARNDRLAHQECTLQTHVDALEPRSRIDFLIESRWPRCTRVVDEHSHAAEPLYDFRNAGANSRGIRHIDGDRDRTATGGFDEGGGSGNFVCRSRNGGDGGACSRQ